MALTTDARIGVSPQVGLFEAIVALSHPQRMRIAAKLAEGRNYVSQLARDLQMSRPLLHLHLARLEAAGLVRSEMEVSDDGKAMRYVVLTPFSFHLTPDAVVAAARELNNRDD
ncbi:MAG: winged helix-turn-helix domain-containing protein [Chloroflexi bacterium]|nr:winged helix-turn-helix domain-containing protein [Chloroflexota bacterium]MDA1240904.1 winged helix-turn-helix domain-containing protein [Chloroflexota bacterium]MQC25511.1 ArsR family transcriptional regulator [Chloroflexota bacterium]